MAFMTEEPHLKKKIFWYKKHLGIRFERKLMTDDKGASKSWKWATEETCRGGLPLIALMAFVEGGLKRGESEERKCLTKLLQ